MKTKTEYRQELATVRASLTLSDVAEKSAVIEQKVIDSVDWSNVTRVHSYNAKPAWQEVMTTNIVAFLRENWPNIEVVIAQEAERAPFPDGQFDIIIVPMLGFDVDKSRLGFGGGWYDRFLATQTHAKKIGLAYEASRVETIPTESYDIGVDTVITENAVYY